MTDFDTALERLVTDPGFRAELATDPGRALAGYELTADELGVLRSQVDTATGAGRRLVEQRTSKASLFGLLTPMGGIGLGDLVHGHGGGDPADFAGMRSMERGSSGLDSVTQPVESGASFTGQASSGASFTDSVPHPELGAAHPGAELDGAAVGGYAPRHDGVAEDAAQGVTRHADLAPANYHTRVDADGDGRWDNFTAVDRGNQGVDLVVDRDHDGRAEFIGHDLDRDGLIDEASTDTDHDGVLDARWVDTNGDGWLDSRQAPPPMDSQRAYMHGVDSPR